MYRGEIVFKCDECGKLFYAPDFEWCATVFSQPQRCPKCGSYHSYPATDLLLKTLYKKIWKEMDKKDGRI